MRTKNISYCEKCPRWAGLEKVCKVCLAETALKEVPNKRGGMYYIDQVEKPLVSVTTVMKVIAKPQLDYWKLQKVAEAAFANPSMRIEDAINAPNRVRDVAATKGSDIHNVIENSFKGQTIKVEDYIEPWKNHVEAYLKFCSQVKHQIVEVEKMVWSVQHEYAGMADAIVNINGKVYLLDYKTNKNLYPKDHALQLGAYKLALEEMGIKIDSTAIVHLKADGTYSFVEIKPEHKAFLAALYLYKYINF